MSSKEFINAFPQLGTGIINESSCTVTSNMNIEGKFLSKLAEKITEGLKVNWNDRKIVNNLLETCLSDSVKDLLEEYTNYIIYKISDKYKKKYNLKSNANFDYCTHAKLDDIIEELINQNNK